MQRMPEIEQVISTAMSKGGNGHRVKSKEFWKEKRFGSLIACIDGGQSFPGEDRPAQDGEAGVLKVSSVSYDRFLPNEHKALSERQRDEASVYPKADRIIISRSNTPELVGASVYIDRDYPDLYLPDTLWQITVREGVSARWLSFFLRSQFMRAQFIRIATGTSGSMKKLSMRVLKRIVIPVPPYSEQLQIASILNLWDAAIENVDALIHTKEHQKNALRERLLTGEARFPEFRQSKEKETTKIGEIPPGWTVEPFGNLAERVTESFDPEGESEPLRCVELEHIEPETGHLVGYTSSSEQTSTKTRFKHGQVLYGKLRPYLRKFWRAEFEGVCSTEIWVLDAHPKMCNNRFLYHLVQSERFARACAVTAGTKMPRANWNYVRDSLHSVPPSDEQVAISNALEAAEDEIQNLRNHRTSFGREERALMQRLLTGDVRVPGDYEPPEL